MRSLLATITSMIESGTSLLLEAIVYPAFRAALTSGSQMDGQLGAVVLEHRVGGGRLVDRHQPEVGEVEVLRGVGQLVEEHLRRGVPGVGQDGFPFGLP